MMRILIAGLSGLALTACAVTPGTETPMDGTPDARPPHADAPIIDRTGHNAQGCAEEAYKVLVGQRLSEVDRASLPEPNRAYGPGDAVTMDYRPDRLNLVTDGQGVIAEVKCG